MFLLALRKKVPEGVVRLLVASNGDNDRAILLTLALRDPDLIELMGPLLADTGLGDGLLYRVLIEAAVQSEAAVPRVIATLRHLPPSSQQRAWRVMQRVLAQQPSAEDLRT